MGWKGVAIGSCLGSLFGGPLGALLGALLGNSVEKHFGGGTRSLPRPNNSLVFCASAAAMLAKMAKADGQVTQSEIAAVERAFQKLGFGDAARKYAINVFRKAKNDSHTIYEYAQEFAQAIGSVEVREFFYELLWEVAAADGTISSSELQILGRIPSTLGIRSEWYAYFTNIYLRHRAPSAADELAQAYSLLGVSSSDSTETLKRRYRELAKRNHPDALRAQGLPEEMVGKATERMSRINAAWAKIRESRGI